MFHFFLPNLRSPGKKGSQLVIAHHLIVGKVRRIRYCLLILILEILHKHPLFIEGLCIFPLHPLIVEIRVAETRVPVLPGNIPHPVEQFPDRVLFPTFDMFRDRLLPERPFPCGQRRLILLSFRRFR